MGEFVNAPRLTGFGPSTDEGTLAHWTRKTSGVTGPMASQIAKTAQVVDTMAESDDCQMDGGLWPEQPILGTPCALAPLVIAYH
jgi:hypothetical protein